MDEGRLYHLSMGVIGLSLGTNAVLTAQNAGVGGLAGAAGVAGGTCLVVLSAYSLLADTGTTISGTATYLAVFGAVLSVAGTALVLLG